MIGWGVSILWGSKIAFSHWLSQWPLTQGWRYRAACDYMICSPQSNPIQSVDASNPCPNSGSYSTLKRYRVLSNAGLSSTTVLETADVEPTTWPSRVHNFVKIGTELRTRNRSTTDEIDTETEICISLKSEFYFRFRWQPSTKSTPINNFNLLSPGALHLLDCNPSLRNRRSA